MQARFVAAHRPFLATFAALLALAWLLLWQWDDSPSGKFLHHAAADHIDRGIWPLPFLFIVSWSLMTVAMMLPSSVPLVVLFHSLTRRRPDHCLHPPVCQAR